MRNPSKPEIAAIALYASLALNVGVTGWDLASGHVVGAALQSVVAAFLAGWLALHATVDRWLAAKLGEAIAQRRMAEIAQQAVEREVASDRVRVSIRDDSRRVN